MNYSIELIEKDRSLSAVPNNDVSTFIVGVASWGPINTVETASNIITLINSVGYAIKDNLNSIALNGEALLQSTNTLYYTRIADSNAAAATATFQDSEATPEDTITVSGKWKGTFGNSLSISIADGDTAGTKLLTVQRINLDGTVDTVETFDNLTKTGENSYEERINDKSDYIVVTDISANSNQPNNLSKLLTGGNDGASNITPSDYIGTVIGNTKTGLLSVNNKEAYDITLLLVPGISEPSVVAAEVALANKIYAMAILEPPMGLTAQEAKDWHNAEGSFIGTGIALNSEDATLAYPEGNYYDTANSQKVFLPVSTMKACVIINSIGKYGIDAIPAGTARGLLPIISGLATDVSDADVKTLMGNANRINPFVRMSGRGIIAMGDYTTFRKDSAKSKLHVMLIAKKLFRGINSLAKDTLYEYNTRDTRSIFANGVIDLLNPHFNAGSISKYNVVCDESNNTDSVLRTDSFVADIYVQFASSVKTMKINFIYSALGSQITLT